LGFDLAFLAEFLKACNSLAQAGAKYEPVWLKWFW
jgi:hypothetical protein